MTDLSGKVAIVTGASRGLGRSMAKSLISAGAAVTATARSGDELDAFVAEARDAGGQALACQADVCDEVQVEHMVEATVETFGRVDIVVNSSGVVASTPLLEQQIDEWDTVIATNLRGTYLVTRAAGRYLVAQGSGKVINIASHFALQGVANHGAYSASKAGVIAFTRSLAIEWAPSGIQVNAIAPGYFATPLNEDMRRDQVVLERVNRAIPAGRMGRPEELGPWLLLLASSSSDFMTGEVIVIDGGQSVR